MISIIKLNSDAKNYEKMVWFFFIWTILSRWFDTSRATWTVGMVFSFLGYVLIGDVLKHKIIKKNNLRGILLLIGGNIILCLDYFLLYQCVLAGGDYYNKMLSKYGAPLVVIAIIMIFCAFAFLDLHINMSYLSSLSFYVFLNHKIIIEFLSDILFIKIEELMDERLVIIILVELLITFVLAFFVAVITDNVFKRIINKHR